MNPVSINGLFNCIRGRERAGWPGWIVDIPKRRD